MNTKTILTAVIISVFVLGVTITSIVTSTTESPPTTTPTEEPQVTLDVINDDMIIEDKIVSSLPDIIDVGVILPYVNHSNGHYMDTGKDIKFAVDDFNDYLKELGAHWRMNLIQEATFTDRSLALEKIESLNSQGIKLVIGPESSREIHHIKHYVDANDIVLISPISTAPDLAIDDNIFRMVPDDNQQSKVMSLLLQEQGIKAIVPMYRGDVWGDDWYESTKNNFEDLGGVMDEGIRYSLGIPINSYDEINLLSDLVNTYVAEYSVDEVAVLLIGSPAPVRTLNFTDSYENLREVRWFGSNVLSRYGLSNDLITATFIEDVRFVSTQYTAFTNDVYVHVKDHFMDNYHVKTPYIRVYPIYDSVFVLGKTILATDSIDPLVVSDALPGVAAMHIGATGTINLNEFGDREFAYYDLWTIRDGEWVEYGRFNSESGTFDYYMIEEVVGDS